MDNESQKSTYIVEGAVLSNSYKAIAIYLANGFKHPKKKILDSYKSLDNYYNAIKNKIKQPTQLAVLEQFQRAENADVKIIDYYSKMFPVKIKRLYDPPIFIFTKGNINLLFKPATAIIGTRNPSPVSLLLLNSLITKKINCVIISGLAIGVDTFSHYLSINKTGTIAVTGAGLDIIYPKANSLLYKKLIYSGNGLIISELLMGTHPKAFHFPARNRIIAALADNIVLLESPVKGGGLITIDFCYQLGKDPYVFIHPLQWQNSGGKQLLHNNCAQPLFAPEHFIYHYDDLIRRFSRINPFKKIEKLLNNQLIFRLWGGFYLSWDNNWKK